MDETRPPAERDERLEPTDEELSDPHAQAGIRSDTGASGETPKEEEVGSPRGTPGLEKGPVGSGEEPGYGHLGSGTSGGAGAPEAGRD